MFVQRISLGSVNSSRTEMWYGFPRSAPVLSVVINSTGEMCFSGSADSSIICWSIPPQDLDPYGPYSKFLHIHFSCYFFSNRFFRRELRENPVAPNGSRSCEVRIDRFRLLVRPWGEVPKESRWTRMSRHDNEMAARLNCTGVRGLNSHHVQSFTLSLCGPGSVTGANARKDVWIYNTIFYPLF